MQISSSPYLFFSFNAIVVALFCLIYLKVLNLSNPLKIINKILIALFALSIGFVTVMFGILYPERMLLLYLSIFILCSYYVIYEGSRRVLVAGILFSNLCIYLKEPMFIALFVFGALIVYEGIRRRRGELKLYGGLIISSSAIYALLYVLLIVGKRTRGYTRYTENTNVALETLRGVLNYALNDGLIIFFLTSVVVYRIYRVAFRKDKFMLFYDGLLLAGFSYLCVFVYLGIFETYYLLPCYVFSGVGLVYFYKSYIRNIIIKICLVIGLFGFLSSNVPSGIYTMINLKAMGVQFNEVLDFSSEYIKQNPNTNVFFDGIGRGRELYAEWYAGYYGEYLNRIYKIYDFDILTNEPNLKDIRLSKDSPYTYKNSMEVSEIQSGDLLILNNTTINNATKEYIASLQKDYTLLFKSDFSTIPYISLKPLLKYVNARYVKSNAEIFGHQNIFRLPLESYVFVRK